MISEYGHVAAVEAAAAIRNQIGPDKPELALILGSGLGGLADTIENATRISYADIPGFHVPTALGHAGALIAGKLAGKSVVALSGRFHLYEGHAVAVAGFPVRVMHELGARSLFVSNAAGGINPAYSPGDIMIITDHLNLMWTNPLIGPQQVGEERFTDMSEPYDPLFRRAMSITGETVGVELREGVYAALFGPSYETRAEVRMLAGLGADAVGMSTVPEVLVARALGMRCIGLSCITNAASGVTGAPVTHAEVLDVGAKVATRFQSLVREFVGSVELTK